jgi:hypothetical protein
MKTKTSLLLWFLLAHTLSAAEPAQTVKLDANRVIAMWRPQLETTSDYQHWGGSPKQSRNVAAYSFRVVGPKFEELWNHYASLCGIKERYDEKRFLNSADTGPKGSYVVSDRAAGAPDDKPIARGLSLFLLKTDEYTVTITFQPAPDGKSIIGSLSAVTPQ